MSSPWRQPFEFALQRNAPQRERQVATVSPEGLPSVRPVVLRGLTPEGAPYFYTDLRSRKAAGRAADAARAQSEYRSKVGAKQ